MNLYNVHSVRLQSLLRVHPLHSKDQPDVLLLAGEKFAFGFFCLEFGSKGEERTDGLLALCQRDMPVDERRGGHV